MTKKVGIMIMVHLSSAPGVAFHNLYSFF